MVTLAIVGSRTLGQPYYLSNEGEGSIYPVWGNTAQFNYAIKKLNAVIKNIAEKERETNPDFDPRKDLEVITGDADGADHIAMLWAKYNQLTCHIIAAKWKVFGKSAGHRRNPDILAPADYIVSFWDGESPGTKGGIEYAKKHEKKLKVVLYKKHAPDLPTRPQKKARKTDD